MRKTGRAAAAVEVPMFHSHVVEVSGQVAGAAVTQANRVRFIAIDPRLEEIDGSEWRTLADLHRAADHLIRTGSLPRRAAQPSL